MLLERIEFMKSTKKVIVALIGARPQIIKHSAIERAVKTRFSEEIDLVTIHSGQHYSPEMSAVFFEEMGMDEPQFNLNVGSASHAQQTAVMMQRLDEYLDVNPCDAFLVYGDTNSTLAGAVVASKRQIPVIHIEAGLRSFDKAMPEEINRIMTDHVSSILFCPTPTAVQNLKDENILHHDESTMNAPAVYACGDIMFDNSLHFSKVAESSENIVSKLKLENNQYILSTIHRDSNTDQPEALSGIFSALLQVIEQHQLPIVLPLHPRTKKQLSLMLSAELLDKVNATQQLMIIEPVGFLDMIALEKNARLICTDSGGVQKEAYFFKKPAVILRPHTEWVEIIENGCAQLVSSDTTKIIAAVDHYLQIEKLEFPSIFGDGDAAAFILKKIVEAC